MYYNYLKKRIIACSKLKVPITKSDRYKYRELIEQNPVGFRKNYTKYFYMKMREYVRHGKVWRINLSGTTRHGKSEVAQTWTMVHIDEFNKAIKDNCFEYLKQQGVKYKQQHLNKLTAEDIMFSQSSYLYNIREAERTNNIIFGKSHIIDEDEQSIGGTGSYSERLELKNINNITAQALQNEYQLRPDKFILLNAPFGLHQEKMDRVNKINWSMLYEFKSDPTRTRDYVFLGWVATPLHDDKALRIAYNERKQKNILKVLSGSGDERLNERVRIATLLTDNEFFNARTFTNKGFVLSKQQQESILNEWILEGKVQNFNSVEKYEIVEHARLLIEKELIAERKKAEVNQ